jgi:hypothetical protein
MGMSGVFAALLLFSLSARAFEFPHEYIEYIDDTKIVAFIDNEDIAVSPLWVPGQGKLPLNIEAALERVHKYIDAKLDIPAVKLEEIELKRIPHADARWHYLVVMHSENAEGIKLHYFVVLLSGKVIPALEEPEAYK